MSESQTSLINTKEEICINLEKLANISCLFHFDTTDRHIQLEAYRFWPRTSGQKRPDPSVLVKALEEIPMSGIVREVLFPLLWKVLGQPCYMHFKSMKC